MKSGRVLGKLETRLGAVLATRGLVVYQRTCPTEAPANEDRLCVWIVRQYLQRSCASPGSMPCVNISIGETKAAKREMGSWDGQVATPCFNHQQLGLPSRRFPPAGCRLQIPRFTLLMETPECNSPVSAPLLELCQLAYTFTTPPPPHV